MLSLILLYSISCIAAYKLPYPVHATNDILENDIIEEQIPKETSTSSISFSTEKIKQYITTESLNDYTQNNTKPITIFRLHRYGLGCNLINMLTHKIYFEKYLQRKFIVDESSYQYKR